MSRKIKKKISKKDWIRFWISFIREYGIIFLLTPIMVVVCIASVVVPFIPCFVEEKKPTPYDELYGATGIGSSVIDIDYSAGATGLYQLTMKTGEKFVIQSKYFRDYLHDHSKETLEKKLEELLTSGTEINLKYEIGGFGDRKFVRELRVGDVEVVTYQSEPDAGVPRIALFILCILVFLLSFVLSILSVWGCQDIVRNELSKLKAKY